VILFNATLLPKSPFCKGGQRGIKLAWVHLHL
jgi:hypothetical protein